MSDKPIPRCPRCGFIRNSGYCHECNITVVCMRCKSDDIRTDEEGFVSCIPCNQKQDERRGRS